MSKQDVRIECMAEIFDTLKVSATPEQIKQIVEDFSLHLEMENELNSYQHIGHKEECSKCNRLEDELKSANKTIEIYRENVMRRRNTRDVWIEGDTVMYKP